MNKLGWMVLVVGTLAAGCGEPESSIAKNNAPDGEPTKMECEGDACEEETGTDAAGLVVGAASAALIEGGEPVTVPLKLTRRPTSDVTVNLVALEATYFEIAPASLTFGPDGWGTSQVVTVTPLADVIDADRTVTIEPSMVSDDEEFAGASLAPIELTLFDSESEVPENNGVGPTPELIVESVAGLRLAEGGDPLEIRVRLTAAPQADMVIPVATSDETEAVSDTAGLTFTTSNWSSAQTLLLRGVDDLQADGDQSFDLSFGPFETDDERVHGLSYSVTFTSVDGNCGNGVVDGAEACEPDGSTSPQCAYGDQSCTYCESSCQLVPGEGGGWCGDGIVNGPEECEGPEEACKYGESSCTTCRGCREVAGSVSGFCGDGVVNGPEECDGGSCCTATCTNDPACGAKCLMISEYIEGYGENRAIEIYNCDTTPVRLERYELCNVRDGDTGCSNWYDMQGTLQPGTTRVICNQNAGAELFAYCDVFEGYATNFNGDDRVFIYYDEDNDGAWSATDTIVDAFGELATKPAGYAWADAVYERCYLDTYDGMGAWTLTNYFQMTSTCDINGCDYSGLGVAPIGGGCF